MDCVSIKRANLLNIVEHKKILLKICEIFCLHRNRQTTWQSYQMCQTKILSPFDKNSLSKPNLKPQFIIGGWSEAGGFYMKITQNCQISQGIAADFCNNTEGLIQSSLVGYLVQTKKREKETSQCRFFSRSNCNLFVRMQAKMAKLKTSLFLF